MRPAAFPDLSSTPVPDDVLAKVWTFADVISDDVKTSGPTAAWVVLNNQGRVQQNKICGQVCNAGISSGSYVIGFQTAKTVSGNGRRFFDWFLNRSWAAPFVHCPDNDFGTDKAVVLSGTMPSNWLVGALTLQRTVREHFCRIEIMYDLVDKFGCSEDLAFLTAFSFHGGDGWPSINTNHNSIAPEDPSYWRNFMSRNVQKTNRPFVENSNYYGITAMWGRAAEFSSNTFGKRLLDSLATGWSADKIIIPNPFKPVVTTSSSVSKKTIYDAMPDIMAAYDNK